MVYLYFYSFNIIIEGKQRNVAEIMKELEDLQIKAGRDDQSPEPKKSPKGTD